MSTWKFRDDVIQKWQDVWQHICEMAYERKNIVEKLIIEQDNPNEAAFYERNKCDNEDKLTLEYTWANYSRTYKDALVVPELKFIFVPRSLFECLGVYAWFKYSFPNCSICFWEDGHRSLRPF